MTGPFEFVADDELREMFNDGRYFEFVRIARVHQYRLPGGSIGGSGKPDPKLLLHEGVLYILDDEDHWDS